MLKLQQYCFKESEIFSHFGQVLLILTCMFAGQHEKSFVPAFFKISTDHLFDKLESGKEL